MIMAEPRIIAIDAMGGDFGPRVTIPGAALSLVHHPDMRFLFVGDKARIEPVLAAHANLAAHCEIIHTDVAVAMDEKPSQALRHGRWKSSMWLALQAVRDGRAHVAVSAGNTGALMAMAKVCLKTMPGIERPALAALWPTISGECVVLDVGANVGANSRQLADFALLGAAMARAVLHVETPSVGLLNIGVEEIKGLDEIKLAHQLLKTANLPFAYHGFVEGDQIGQGVVDVVVAEGFTGNIALKTAEGTARQIGVYLKAAMTRSLMAKAGAFLAQGAFRFLKAKMDPRRVNGGTFLGLNGMVIKSHGGTDATGFASAVDIGYDLAGQELVGQLTSEIAAFHARMTGFEPGVVTRTGALPHAEGGELSGAGKPAA